MMAKGERGIPVQDGRCTEAIFGKRIGDDVSRSVNRPASKRERLIKGRRFAQGVGFEGSVRLWKLYCSIHGLSQRVQRVQRIQPADPAGPAEPAEAAEPADLNLRELDPTTLTPRFETSFRQLNPFRPFKQCELERYIFDDVTEE